MATIWRSDSPLCRCSACGVQLQFHTASDVPYSQDRDHAFVAETIADYEPADLTPVQLTSEIFDLPNSPRAMSCGDELRRRVQFLLGVSWQDLQEALA